MASAGAVRRLQKEYKDIVKSPPPGVEACPEESNILRWYFVYDGPPGSPYADGQYLGSILFPPNYPMAPPAIRVLTPNGRFKTDMSICLSTSEYHPDQWSPVNNASTIILGLVSFMVDVDKAAGTIETDEKTKKLLAKQSHAWNVQHPKFMLFPRKMEAALQKKAMLEAAENEQQVKK